MRNKKTLTLKKPVHFKVGKEKLTIREIKFVSDKKIRAHEDLAYGFVYRIFGYKHAMLTDESSVYDFDFTMNHDPGIEHHTEKYLKKIKKIYNVDVSDVNGLLICNIIKKIISEQKRTKKCANVLPV